MTAIIHAKSFWARPKNNLRAMAPKPKQRGKTIGSHIADLVGLGKAITLCQKECQKKFNAPGNEYVMFKEVTGVNYCNSVCQGCGVLTECNTYIKARLK